MNIVELQYCLASRLLLFYTLRKKVQKLSLGLYLFKR